MARKTTKAEQEAADNARIAERDRRYEMKRRIVSIARTSHRLAAQVALNVANTWAAAAAGAETDTAVMDRYGQVAYKAHGVGHDIAKIGLESAESATRAQAAAIQLGNLFRNYGGEYGPPGEPMNITVEDALAVAEKAAATIDAALSTTGRNAQRAAALLDTANKARSFLNR